MQASHSISMAVALGVNILSQAASILGWFGPDNGEVSNKNPTLLTPTDKTFAIWGVIFTALIISMVAVNIADNQRITALYESRGIIFGVPPWRRVIFAFLMSALWPPLYSRELFGASLAVAVAMTVALISLAVDIGPTKVSSIFNWVIFGLGFTLNGSWLCVACAINFFNVAAYWDLTDKNKVAGSVFASQAIIVVVLSIFPAVWALYVRNPAWTAVCAWALWGVYEQQANLASSSPKFPETSKYEEIARFAWAAAVFNVILSVVGALLLAYGTSSPPERTPLVASEEGSAA